MSQYNVGDRIDTICVVCDCAFTRTYPGMGRPHGHACPSCRKPREPRKHIGNTLQLVCQDCKQTFGYVYHGGGMLPKRCPECCPTPVGTIIQATCQACEQDFEYTFRTYYHTICPPCLKSQKRQANTEWSRNRRGALPRGSIQSVGCQMCGSEFQYAVHKRHRTLCDDCLARQNLAALERENRAGIWNRNRWRATLVAFGYRCAYCGQVPDQFHRDHFIPRSLGGYSDIGNIAPACPDCNYHKHAKHPQDFLSPELYQSITHTLSCLKDNYSTGDRS